MLTRPDELMIYNEFRNGVLVHMFCRAVEGDLLQFSFVGAAYRHC